MVGWTVLTDRRITLLGRGYLGLLTREGSLRLFLDRDRPLAPDWMEKVLLQGVADLAALHVVSGWRLEEAGSLGQHLGRWYRLVALAGGVRGSGTDSWQLQRQVLGFTLGSLIVADDLWQDGRDVAGGSVATGPRHGLLLAVPLEYCVLQPLEGVWVVGVICTLRILAGPTRRGLLGLLESV